MSKAINSYCLGITIDILKCVLFVDVALIQLFVLANC